MIIYHGTKAEYIPNIIRQGFIPNMGNYGIGVYFSTDYDYIFWRYAERNSERIIKCEINDNDICKFISEDAFYKWYKPVPDNLNEIQVWLEEIKDYVLSKGYKAIRVDQLRYSCIVVYDLSSISFVI